jgi:hypothetical protein
VPAPMSSTIDPVGCSTGSPLPTAAAIGLAIRRASRAPAAIQAWATARLCTPLTPVGTAAITRGFARLCRRTLPMRWRSSSSVARRSAITPCLSGWIAAIPSRPRSSSASLPAASGSLVRASTATTLGSDRTISPPRADRTVCGGPQIDRDVAAGEAGRKWEGSHQHPIGIARIRARRVNAHHGQAKRALPRSTGRKRRTDADSTRRRGTLRLIRRLRWHRGHPRDERLGSNLGLFANRIPQWRARRFRF